MASSAISRALRLVNFNRASRAGHRGRRNRWQSPSSGSIRSPLPAIRNSFVGHNHYRRDDAGIDPSASLAVRRLPGRFRETAPLDLYRETGQNCPRRIPQTGNLSPESRRIFGAVFMTVSPSVTCHRRRWHLAAFADANNRRRVHLGCHIPTSKRGGGANKLSGNPVL